LDYRINVEAQVPNAIYYAPKHVGVPRVLMLTFLLLCLVINQLFAISVTSSPLLFLKCKKGKLE